MAAGREPLHAEVTMALASGLLVRFDPFPAYREHLRHLVDFALIGQARLRVVVDAMYGSGRGYLRDLPKPV